MKSILIILLLILGTGLTTLVTAQTGTVAKDTLVVKQFSIVSPGGQFKEELGPGEGRLTFRILAGASTGLDADQILQWLEDGTMKLSGIRLDTTRTITINEYKLSVPVEFEKPLRDEYLETELSISESDWIEDDATAVSLYGGLHSVVDLSLIGEGKRLAGDLASSQVVNPQRFSFEQPNLFIQYNYQPIFELQNGERSDKKQGGFFHRNRYWVMGAATLVASGATAIIMSGGDSVTYLPEPPGRP